MKSGLMKIALLFALLAASAFGWAQNSFKVEAPNVVGQGERFLVKFIANGDVDVFNRPSFSGADIIAGPSKGISSSTTIINGKRTSSYTVTFTYVLEAAASGAVNISEASAEIDGNTYSTRPLSIEIVENASGQTTQSQQAQQTSQVAKTIPLDQFNKLETEDGKKIDHFAVFEMKSGNYGVRAMVDGQQMSVKALDKEDRNAFFEHTTTKAALVQKYYGKELSQPKHEERSRARAM
jgi:hypothetical protein